MLNWLTRARSKLSHTNSGPFVALDLDSRKLRVVHAEPRAKLPKFRKLAAIDLPPGTELADPSAVGAFIREALGGLRLTGHHVAMDVPRSKALLKTVTLPPVEDARELPGMVRYQVEKELPYPLSEAVIDFTVEPRPGAMDAEGSAGGQTVLVAAVRRSVVEYYQRVAAAAEIDLQQLGLRPYADVHCLRACLGAAGRPAADAVLVHLTADEAEINVLLGGSLAFSRSASMSIAHDEHGRPVADSPVDGLVVEVVRTLQSIRAVQRGAEIGRFWIAGDTGREADLAAALHKRIGSPCELLMPVELLRIKKVSGGDGGYITALGLAIGHTERGLPLDFLHPKEPPVERDIARIRATWGAVAAAAIVLVVLGIGLLQRHATASRVESLTNRYNELDARVRPVKRLEQRVGTVQAWLDQDRRWLDHWANLSAAMPPAQEAYITSLKTMPDGSITLTVKAKGSAVITDAARRLREAGYDVRLGSETAGEDEYGYGSTNELRLIPRREPSVEGLAAPPRPADDGSAEQFGASAGGRRRS